MYNLSFYDAVEKCISGQGFIRGDEFKDGVYVKKQGEKLIAIDGFTNKVVGPFYISTGIVLQKYKVFSCVLRDELISENESSLYCKAV